MHSNLSLFIQISNSSRHQVCVFLTGEGMKLTGMIFDNSIYVLIICIYDSLPINFLKAIPGTPLEGTPPLPPAEALRCIALMRLLNPGREIVICGGREHALGQWQSWVFAAGAGMIMTGDYLTTTGRAFAEDHAMLAALGLRALENIGARS